MKILLMLCAGALLASCKNLDDKEALAMMMQETIVPQVALDGTYKINVVITDKPVGEFALRRPEGLHDMYGNSVTFKPDGTFVSAYSADCGNDCFTSSAGRYAWADAHHIKLVADSVKITGECDNQEYTPHAYLGVYGVTQQDGQIKLVKEK